MTACSQQPGMPVRFNLVVCAFFLFVIISLHFKRSEIAGIRPEEELATACLLPLSRGAMKWPFKLPWQRWGLCRSPSTLVCRRSKATKKVRWTHTHWHAWQPIRSLGKHGTANQITGRYTAAFKISEKFRWFEQWRYFYWERVSPTFDWQARWIAQTNHRRDALIRQKSAGI